jgi:hypothetical protein
MKVAVNSPIVLQLPTYNFQTDEPQGNNIQANVVFRSNIISNLHILGLRLVPGLWLGLGLPLSLGPGLGLGLGLGTVKMHTIKIKVGLLSMMC